MEGFWPPMRCWYPKVSKRMSLLQYSTTYVPQYPAFVELTQLHEKLHWHEGEVKLQQDVEDWKLGRVSDTDKLFISSILRLFTESDKAVGSDYFDNLIPAIKNNEARNMLSSFANREGTHQRAYALLSDTLGFGEPFYLEFLEYKEMADKIDFMLAMKNSSPRELAISIVKQGLAEGVCLFASFAMLLNYSRFGKLIGMGDVNQWSIKDESLHVQGLSLLFRELLKERLFEVDDAFKAEIYSLAREVVALEDSFIELVFKTGAPEGITEAEMKQYIRAICDYRMQQFGFKPEYNVENPFEWLEWLTSNSMMENFFETNTAGYSKAAMKGEYGTGY